MVEQQRQLRAAAVAGRSASRSARFSPSSATIWSKRSKSSAAHLPRPADARCRRRSRRGRRDARAGRAARRHASRRCRRESTSTSSPSRSASARNAASASGERQILPRQTNRTAIVIGDRISLVAKARRSASQMQREAQREGRMATDRWTRPRPRPLPSRASALMPGTPCSSSSWSTSSISSTGRSSRSCAEDIKRDLGVEDAQIGFLYGTAFAVFYALFGIPLGRLADSWYRGRLMAIGPRPCGRR